MTITGGPVKISDAKFAMVNTLLLRVHIAMLANGVVVQNMSQICVMMQMEEFSKLVRVEDAIVVVDLAILRVNVAH